MMKNFITLLFLSLNSFGQSTLQTMLRLPDTGETMSYTNTFGEDHDYNINIPMLLNLGNGIIVDSITGLMWQQVDGGEMKIEDAIHYCDTLTLGNHTDWRLPTAQEGFSILNMQNVNPALNINYFPNSNAEYWWTSERQANDTNKIWCTNAGGGIGNHPRTETISAGGTKKFHVRAVRDIIAPSTLNIHFTDHGDGTISDHLTHLMWEKIPTANLKNWEDALIYAEGLTLASYSDWRLPNIKELQSINDETVVQPSVTAPYFQNLGVNTFWSATTLPNQTTKAWYWSTTFGITTYDIKTNTHSVLCVRNENSVPNLVIDVGISSNSEVYPNPFHDFIKLKNQHPNEWVTLSTLQGQRIYEGEEISKKDFSYLPKGWYILHTSQKQFKLFKN